MSLGSFLSSLKIEKRQEKQSYNPYGCTGLGLQFSNSLSNSYAMQISAFYSAVNLISNAVASMPIVVKRYKANGSNIASNHPLNLIFQGKDKGLINPYNAIKLAVEDIILRGNAFFYVYRSQDGTPIRLRHVEPNDVTIYYSKEDYSLLYKCDLVSKGWIEPNDMIHLYLKTVDGIQGISLLSYAKRSIDTANLTENSAKTYYAGKFANSAILTVDGPLSEQQKQEIRQSWMQAFDNSDANSVCVMRGNIKYTPLSRSAEESQLLQNRVFTVQDIARWFQINPILLGDLSHTSYGSLESVQNDFLLHAVSPYVYLLEEELNKKLIKPNERNVYIDVEQSAILVQDKQSAANYYSTLVNSGILSVNEVRRELGFNSVSNGDMLRVAYTDISQNTINPDNTSGSTDDDKDNTDDKKNNDK